MRETKRGEASVTMSRFARRASLSGRLALLCLLPAVAGSACAAASTPFVDPEGERIDFEIANRGFQDATLHVTFSGRRIRLGSVSGTQTSVFTIPWSRSEEIQVEIDLLAGPSVGAECVTRPIVANPGDLIYLEITNQLLQDPECFPAGGPNRPG